jgi:hypothetical protein
MRELKEKLSAMLQSRQAALDSVFAGGRNGGGILKAEMAVIQEIIAAAEPHEAVAREWGVSFGGDGWVSADPSESGLRVSSDRARRFTKEEAEADAREWMGPAGAKALQLPDAVYVLQANVFWRDKHGGQWPAKVTAVDRVAETGDLRIKTESPGHGIRTFTKFEDDVFRCGCMTLHPSKEAP